MYHLLIQPAEFQCGSIPRARRSGLLPCRRAFLYLRVRGNGIRNCQNSTAVKVRLNYRLVFLLLLLSGLAAREIALELRPTFLRPGLHLFAYIGNTADGTLTAIDLIKLTAVATIPVGAGPTGIRAHPTRKEIWGLSSAGGYAWVVAADTNREVARIAVGTQPYALDFSPDGSRAYVAASGSNSVVAIDCATRRIIARARAGKRPWIARVSPDGKLLLVSNHEDSTVSILDAETLASLGAVRVTSHPEQIVILPDSSKAFVRGTTDQISVIDLKRKVLLTNLVLGGRADDLILKPDGGELYIPSSESHGLLIVDTQTNEVAQFLLLGMSPTDGVLSPNRGVLYVSDTAGNDVVPILIGSRQIAHPIPVGQGPGISALTPGGDELLVVDAGSDDLAVIRTRTAGPAENTLAPPPGPMTLIPLGGKPRDLAIKLF